MAVNPRLVITDGTTEVDILGPNSGWKLNAPYWNPKISQYKSGGSFVDAQLAEGRRLVHKEYSNVIETIPLTLSGYDQDKAMRTAHELLELLRQAGDYWTEPYEYDAVWLEVKLACNDCFIGYSRVISGNIPEITNPFGQPFFSATNQATMEDISLVVEREPFWRAIKPGTIIGPLYNLIKNPDFELWNFGVIDSQPDNWTDIETTHITGQTDRDQALPKFGTNALKIRVSGSTLAGASKGITQNISDTKNNTTYTIVAWVRNESVSNGAGRILITYSSQLELYNSALYHGWTLYTGTITTGTNNETVAIHCEILTTAANTDGTFYVDGLMFLEGDWQQEAIDGVLPYMSSSHIVNHWDQASGIIEAGDINYVDVWNIPGNVDSLIRIEVINNTTPADFNNQVEQYAKIRIGQRRSGDVQNFLNYYDPQGVADTTASSDDRLNSPALTSDWKSLGTYLINGEQNVKDTRGRHRVFARVYDAAGSGDPTLQTRVNYFVGEALVKQKSLDSDTAQVRAQWTIADLTKNAFVNWDQRFVADIVGQLGFTIEMSRATGTSQGYLDYVLIMPTDGGYFEATISPPLANKYSLVVDNTNSVTIGAGSVVQEPWRLDWQVENNPTFVQSIAVYNGSLYVGVLVNFGGPLDWRTEVWRKNQGLWKQMYTLTLSIPREFNSAAVYNDVLYFGADPNASGNAVLVSTTDGSIYSDVYTTPSSTNISSLIVYDGLLYLISGQGEVYTWNGTTGTEIRNVNRDGQAEWVNAVVWNNKLYVQWQNTDSGLWIIEEYDSDTNAWVTVVTGDGTNRWSNLVVFNGYIFMGNNENNDTIAYRFDGTTLTSLSATGVTSKTMALAVYNNKIYAILQNQSTYESVDGVTWTVSPAGKPADSDTNTGNNFPIVFGGQLYTSFQGSFTGGQGWVYSYTDASVVYKSLSFKGGTFTAPPHKRHRWVFSYDRQDFINNLDDKALIGIGFVPRYLTLRGKN